MNIRRFYSHLNHTMRRPKEAAVILVLFFLPDIFVFDAIGNFWLHIGVLTAWAFVLCTLYCIYCELKQKI